jgi:hypothetical protein
MLDIETVRRAVGSLSLLRFFPADDEARGMLGEILAAMCPDDDACDWLVRRTLELHNEWPGPVELRAILCSRYPPADGVDAYSSIWTEGIPPSKPTQQELLALPPGPSSGPDPQLAAMIADLAVRKRLSAAEAP